MSLPITKVWFWIAGVGFITALYIGFLLITDALRYSRSITKQVDKWNEIRRFFK